MQHIRLHAQVQKQGLHDITALVRGALADNGIKDGIATLFIRHTSASLVIQENADPSVCRDLEQWLNRLVPEHDALYTHCSEGADDMPAHIKSALTAVSISVPVINGDLALGVWQGIFLWEHRHHRGKRELILSLHE